MLLNLFGWVGSPAAAAVVAHAPTFAEWLRWPSREIIRVAVFTPNLTLVGWTAVGGGAPNTYQISLPRFVFTDLIQGGLYRPCVGLKENATALTRQTSVATVDATAGSWWWDEAAGLLYVRSSTGADPDTFTVYHAQVEFRMATTGLVLNLTDSDPGSGIYHHPWLTDDVPTVSSEMENFLHGVKITATTQITVLNEAFLWYRLLATDGPYWWKNTKAVFSIGGRYNQQDLPWSQYFTDLTMLIEDVACDDEAARFELRPLARQLNVQVPPTPYFESSYPHLGEGVRGTKKWIGYGRTIMRPDLTDISGNGVWTIADAAYQTLFAVHAVNAVHKTTGLRTSLALTTDYIVDLIACTVTIVNAAYAWQTYHLEVDVSGKPDGGGGYLQTVGQIVADLLMTFAGIAFSDIDFAAFNQAHIDAPEELCVWIKQPRVLASILAGNEPELASIEGSVLATVQQTFAGQWTISVWSPSYDPESVIHLQAEDFAVFRPDPKLETLYTGTRVFYHQDQYADDWPVEVAADPSVGYLANTVDVVEKYTYLRNAGDAQILAQRLQLLAGTRTLEIEFVERGSRLAQQIAGARVLVTRAPAPSVDGQFISKAFELIRLDRAPNLAIAGRLSDLHGIGLAIGEWKDSAAADWSALTAEERAADRGFWADSGGRIDFADPASLNVSLWR